MRDAACRARRQPRRRVEVSAHPTRMSALMPLMLALAACSGGGGEPPAQSAALPPNGPSPPPTAAAIGAVRPRRQPVRCRQCRRRGRLCVERAARAADRRFVQSDRSAGADAPLRRSLLSAEPSQRRPGRRRASGRAFRARAAAAFAARAAEPNPRRDGVRRRGRQSARHGRRRISPARSTGSCSTTRRCRRTRST